MTQITPDLGEEYAQPFKSHLKPLYMIIKVDVDADIVYDQDKAEAYANNHCNNMEYELCDWSYPDDEQYPFIAL